MNTCRDCKYFDIVKGATPHPYGFCDLLLPPWVTREQKRSQTVDPEETCSFFEERQVYL